jgi:TolB-like protein
MVTGLIREELASIKRYTLLDSSDMEMMLARERFKMTGCTSPECAARMGKILDVEIVLTGTITKLSNAYQISVSLVNVETGNILKSIDQKVKTAAELEQACKQVVEKIK